MNILLALGLLLAPSQQLDLSVGPKVLGDQAHVYVTPGYHLHYPSIKLAVQAPIRIRLVDSRLRASDLDSISDYGRIIRYVQIADGLQIGAMANVSDEHHLILDHYFNQIDDDRHRTAMLIQAQSSDVKGTFFVDQVLGRPVVGLLATMTPTRRLRLYLASAADTARITPTSQKDGSLYGAASLTSSYAIVQDKRFKIDTYASIAQTHSYGTGAHLGLETQWKHLWGWRLRLRSEGMVFTDGYNWAPFDLLYLIRRQRVTANHEGAKRRGFGGRLQITMARQSIEFGAETSGAIGSPQQTNTFWIELPKKPFHLFAVIHAGRHTLRTHPFDNENISAALSAQLHLSATWMIETTMTHVQRDNGNGYRGFLEAGIFTNWRLTFQ